VSKKSISEAFQELGLSTVTPEQEEIVASILKRDVFLTGFGKSSCFQCLHSLLNKVAPSEGPSIVVVVTPPTAIMKGQVSGWVITHPFILRANDASGNPAHAHNVIDARDTTLFSSRRLPIKGR